MCPGNSCRLRNDSLLLQPSGPGDERPSHGAPFAYQNTHCFTTKHMGVFILLGFLGMQGPLVFSWPCLRRCYQLGRTIHTPYRLGRASPFYRCPQYIYTPRKRSWPPLPPIHLHARTFGDVSITQCLPAIYACLVYKNQVFNSEKLRIVGRVPSVAGCNIWKHTD